jgi:hypothetical protein
MQMETFSFALLRQKRSRDLCRKDTMTFLRSLSLLPVRISQILGWTADPQNYTQAFLSKDEIRRKQELSYEVLGSASLAIQSKLKLSYVPPAYKPPESSFQN